MAHGKTVVIIVAPYDTHNLMQNVGESHNKNVHP